MNINYILNLKIIVFIIFPGFRFPTVIISREKYISAKLIKNSFSKFPFFHLTFYGFTSGGYDIGGFSFSVEL